MSKRIVCPRCNEIGYLISAWSYNKDRHKYYYYYTMHNVKEDGRWNTRKCYLGSDKSDLYLKAIKQLNDN